jgi:hypothetical protein
MSDNLHGQAALFRGDDPIPPRGQRTGGSVRLTARLDTLGKRNVLPLPGIEPRFLGPLDRL